VEQRPPQPVHLVVLGDQCLGTFDVAPMEAIVGFISSGIAPPG
jgi:hypothetical protein